MDKKQVYENEYLNWLYNDITSLIPTKLCEYNQSEKVDDDGGKRRPHPVTGDFKNSGVYVGANLLVNASEGEFYEQDGSFYYKVRKSNLEEDLGTGSGYEPNNAKEYEQRMIEMGKKYKKW